MELKKLEYLESVYQNKSFTAAADECFISQPAITKSIRSLEKELNTQLIRRNTRHVEFTDAGECFMSHVPVILREMKAAQAELQQIQSRQMKVLRVGLALHISKWFLPALYCDPIFQKMDTMLLPQENTQAKMMEDLLNDQNDFLFSIIPDFLDPGLYDRIVLLPCELGLLVSKKQPMASYPAIPFEALEGVLFFNYLPGSLASITLTEIFRQRNIHPNYQQQTLLINSVEKIVANSSAVTPCLMDGMDPLPEDSPLIFKSFESPLHFDEGILLKHGKKQSRIVHDAVTSLESFVKKRSGCCIPN